MEAGDLAREVASYARPRDRPSPLVLVVYSRSWRGRDVRSEDGAMRITAPIEGGVPLLRIAFPAPHPPVGFLGRDNARDGADERVTLEYDAVGELEGAAACVEGHMTHRQSHDVMLFALTEDGGLGPYPLSRWSLSFEEERGNRTASRLEIIRQILRSLFVK